MTDLFDDTTLTIDRSDLETFASCPMQARLKREHKPPVGIAAEIGNAVHHAISVTMQHYIDAVDAGEILRAPDIAERLEANMNQARPDVQPEAIEACRAAVWGIARTLASTDPDNIRRFDGGKGERSGQLSYEPRSGVIVTSEVDLLRATASLEVLREDDWKSGWKFYTADSVARSFQFTLHAVLVFRTYPGVNQLDVVVWNLRTGQALPAVQFYRRKLEQYEARIASAVDTWLAYDDVLIERVPCWPATEKCRICDVAARCPAVDRLLPQGDADLLRRRIAVARTLEEIDAELERRVKASGEPISVTNEDGSVESCGVRGAMKPQQSFKVWSEKAR